MNTRRYSGRRGSFAGSTCSTFVRAASAQPLPCDQYDSECASVRHKPENSSNMPTQFVDKREDRLIAFGTVTPEEQTFRSRLRATGKGTFVVPPPYVEAMYDLSTKARGKAATITVTDAP